MPVDQARVRPEAVNIVIDPSGWLLCGTDRVRCALGRSGIRATKREGDGATPAGKFPLRRVYYRPDRLPSPKTGLPTEPLRQADGWCDAPEDPAYNSLVQLPHRSSAEALWRGDHLYDVIVVIGFNDDPPEPGRGSAIFLHLASATYSPTAGCVAVTRADAIAMLEKLGPASSISIEPAAP